MSRDIDISWTIQNKYKSTIGRYRYNIEMIEQYNNQWKYKNI